MLDGLLTYDVGVLDNDLIQALEDLDRLLRLLRRFHDHRDPAVADLGPWSRADCHQVELSQPTKDPAEGLGVETELRPDVLWVPAALFQDRLEKALRFRVAESVGDRVFSGEPPHVLT